MDTPTTPRIENIDLLMFRLERQDLELQALKKDVHELENHISQSETQRAIQEKRQLVAGISFLGSIIFLLVGVIWSYRNVIFRG